MVVASSVARVVQRILFALLLISGFSFIVYELIHWLTPEESWVLHNSDDRSYSSATVPHGKSSRILLVSSLFLISKSKHSKEQYRDWLQRFLQPITTEVYFYTSPDVASTVQAARGRGLQITIDTNYNTPFDVPPLKGLEGWYDTMHRMDREKSYHSPELYSIWNAKPFFVDNAIRVMESKGKTYDYVFWCDGGSFRYSHVYMNWPDPSRIEEIWQEGSRLSGTKAEDLLFFPIQNPPYSARRWKEEKGPIDIDFSEGEHVLLISSPPLRSKYHLGSFFGGSPSTMAWWARTFYTYHDYYVSKRLFVGKDQTVFNAILMLFNERIITVWVNDPKAPAADKSWRYKYWSNSLGSCGDEWYYYQFWLSNRQTRDEMGKIWLENDKQAQNVRWWKKISQCRLTRVLALSSLLKRVFGEEWKAPIPTLDASLR